MKINITKNTPKKYLIYLTNVCKDGIEFYSWMRKTGRGTVKDSESQIGKYQDFLEKINLCGLSTDINGNLTA